MRYGNPPTLESCVEVECPPTVRVKATQGFIGKHPDQVAQMRVATGRPLEPAAVARQLNQALDFCVNGDYVVFVPDYGTFYLGKEGWEYVGVR